MDYSECYLLNDNIYFALHSFTLFLRYCTRSGDGRQHLPGSFTAGAAERHGKELLPGRSVPGILPVPSPVFLSGKQRSDTKKTAGALRSPGTAKLPPSFTDVISDHAAVSRPHAALISGSTCTKPECLHCPGLPSPGSDTRRAPVSGRSA